MTSFSTHFDAAIDAVRAQDLPSAAVALEKALEVDPAAIEARFRLANVYRDLYRLDDAEREMRAVADAAPQLAKALTGLGVILLESGRPAEAVAAHEAAMRADPSYVTAATNWLSAQQYLPGVTSATLARSHARWSELHAPAAPPPRPRVQPLSGRPLVVGFVSPDLSRHPVGLWSVRLFENLDHRLIRPIVFSTRPQEYEDDISHRIARTTSWNAVFGLSDTSLAGFIKASKVDVLIDMSGHTGHNRLQVFAARAAPVQASWIGYTGTTGLPTMDYLITAAALAPPGEEAFVRERIVRLPHTHMCYEPLYAPTVGPLPAKANGYVTFGCFNNPAKFSEDVLSAFAAVMRGVPGSRLKLRYRSLADQSTRARLLRVLEANGIAPGRIEMAGELPRESYLASYDEIDLALDSFPFSGGMTTCDALWMGCPVVTFPGQTFAGRTTAMILSAIGLPELVGQDRAAYETLAIQLASGPEKLSAIRTGLRARMMNSPACDGPAFAQAFTHALHYIWATSAEPHG